MVAELGGAGLDAREARWLVDEFGLAGADDVLREAAARRLRGEPLQYVIGHWPFRGLELDVDARALIPRPETEELVEIALGVIAADQPAPTIVDLGCGSGAIGLALLDELARRGVAATLLALDESTEALALAQHNAQKHGIVATFVRSSWFDALDDSLRGRIDLVVANPPYVAEAAFDGLDPVLRYEPRGALVAPDAMGVAGFGDLEVIITQAIEWLAPQGVLVCEHGDTHRAAVLELATSVGFASANDANDLAGLPRFLVARR